LGKLKLRGDLVGEHGATKVNKSVTGPDATG
jgi:hypothetical protein